MQVWNVLHAARWKYKKNLQKFVIWAPLHNVVGLYLHNYGMYQQSEKVLNINISSRCPHTMVNFGPLTAEIGLPVWGTPSNFNRFRFLASLLQRRRSPEANQTLHDIWSFPGQVHYIYFFWGGFCPWRNFATCKIHFASSLAFSYIGSITAWHSGSGP